MSDGPREPDPNDPGADGPAEGGYPPPPPPPSWQPGAQPQQGAYPQPGPYPPGAQPPAGYGQGYDQGYGQGYNQGHGPGPYPPNPNAPYGVHPVTGVPYSDKTKLVAGLLQILIPLGIGRFYIGDTKTGVWQLVVAFLTCGIGGLWSFVDGIIILATDNVTDAQGRPLRMT